jgi:hypothetical protein
VRFREFSQGITARRPAEAASSQRAGRLGAATVLPPLTPTAHPARIATALSDLQC